LSSAKTSAVQVAGIFSVNLFDTVQQVVDLANARSSALRELP
jgi:hypothetical protein